MKAKKIRNYSKAVPMLDENGIIIPNKFRRQPVWVYALSGKAEELAKYKQIQEADGNNYHEEEDTGKPLFFSPSFHGTNCIVAISHNPTTGVDRVYVDDSQALEMQSIADGLTGKIGDEFAKLASAKLFGEMFGGADTSSASTPKAKAEEQEEEVGSEDADIEQP
jgi:hypothetical protein